MTRDCVPTDNHYPMTYLHIRGTLSENMVYRPRPGRETNGPGRRSEGDSAYQLVLLDSHARVLVSVAPQVNPRGCGSPTDPLRFGVRGAIALHPDATAYELRRGEIRLHGAAIPSAPPSLAAPRCHTNATGLTLRWEHCAPAEGAHNSIPMGAAAYTMRRGATATGMTYSIVAAMENGRRITLARNLTEPAHTLDLSVMPVPGKGKVFLVANDGVRSSEVEAADIHVPPRPPTVHILAPVHGTQVAFGETVSVLGCLLDMGGQPIEPETVSWSLDGERIASGTLITVLAGLAPGTHRLTLWVEGGGMDRVEESLSLEVAEPDADYHAWAELMTDKQHPGLSEMSR